MDKTSPLLQPVIRKHADVLKWLSDSVSRGFSSWSIMLLPRLFFQQLTTKAAENIHIENNSSLYIKWASLSGQLLLLVLLHTVPHNKPATVLWEGKLAWSSSFPLAHVAALCVFHLAYGRLSLHGVMAKARLNTSLSAMTTSRRKLRSQRKHTYWVGHVVCLGLKLQKGMDFCLAEYCVVLTAGWQIRPCLCSMTRMSQAFDLHSYWLLCKEMM